MGSFRINGSGAIHRSFFASMKFHLTKARVSLGTNERATVRFIHLDLFLLQYSAAACEFEFLYLHYCQYQFD